MMELPQITGRAYEGLKVYRLHDTLGLSGALTTRRIGFQYVVVLPARQAMVAPALRTVQPTFIFISLGPLQEQSRAMETKAPGIIAVLVICTIFSAMFAIARMYSRLHLRIIRIDDWLLLVAWLINIALTILSFFALHYGAGRHTWDIDLTTLKPNFKIQYATGILYHAVLPITKLSMCCLYLQIIDVKRVSKILIQCLIAYLVVTGLGLVGYISFECTPISDYWNNQSGPNCSRRTTTSTTMFYFNSASNIFTDLCIIAIILPVIAKLQIGKRQKYGLYGIVCVGLLAVLSSVLRVVVVSQVIGSGDPAWVGADMIIWSCLECNTSLICAAAPCTRPALNKLNPQLLPSFIRRTVGEKSTQQNSIGLKSWEINSTRPRDGKTHDSVSVTALVHDESNLHMGSSRPTSQGQLSQEKFEK